MKVLKALALLVGLCASPSHAWVHGSANVAVGKAQINLGGQDVTAQTFINLFNAASVSFTSGATPAAVDADQYPVRNFSGTITGQLGPQANTLSTTGPWTMGWDAGRSCFRMVFLKVGTATNITNATVTNNGSGNLTISGGCGSAGSVTVNWSSTSGVTYQFDGTYTQWGSNTSGRMWFVRQSDQASFNNGVYWTPEFVNLVKGLKPESIRPMGWNLLLISGQTGTNAVNYGYRLKPTAFTFNSVVDFPPGTRSGGGLGSCPTGGGTVGFCNIAVSGRAMSADPAPDTSLAGYVDGEQITGVMASAAPTTLFASAIANNGGKCQFTTTDTSLLSAGAPVAILGAPAASGCNSQATTISTIDSATQFTTNTTFSATCSSGCGQIAYQTLSITGKSGGAKLVLGINAFPLSTGGNCAVGSGNAASFTYIATLDKFLACGNGVGVSNAIPLEAQAQLANLVNANLWYTFPNMANDAFVTGAANTLYGSLNSSLLLITEFGNEVWNPSFIGFQYSIQMGIALGITTFASPQYIAHQSLRIRQINGNLLPSTSWGSSARLDRTFCLQSATDLGTISAGLGGTVLISPGTAAYQAYVGGSAVNYNTSPNRPGDFTKSICMAPYVSGGSAFSGQSVDTQTAPTSYDAALLNNAVSLWNGANQAGAIALVDQSIRGDVQNRVQTVTASGTTFTTPAAHNFSVNDIVRFTVSGGTSYGGLNLNSPYAVLSTSTAGCPGAVICNFTAGQIVNGAAGSAVSAGTAGSGTTSAGYLTSSGNGYSSQSIFGIISASYTKYQNAALNALSPQSALGAFKVRWYEGALEPTAPTTAQCTAISINSTDCATLATIVSAWRNDASASATTQYYYQTFMGTASNTITTGAMSQSTYPSWLVLNGTTIWSLNSNTSLASPASFQTYYGFQTFSSN